MRTCESCRNLKGKMRVFEGRFDFKGYECSCSKGFLWNDYQKAPKVFQLGSRASSKDYIYETWRVQAGRCTDYESMD